MTEVIGSFKERLRNIAIAFDETGNAIGGGNPDTTISGRAYRNTQAHPRSLFWKGFRGFIDKSFWAMDGEGHCEQAFNNDSGEIYHDAAWYDRLILVLLSIPICIIVILITYPYWVWCKFKGE